MKKILIADERIDSRLIMKMILRQYPIKIIEAKDGKEAMKKIMKHQPDLTFLDIHMPEKNAAIQKIVSTIFKHQLFELLQ